MGMSAMAVEAEVQDKPRRRVGETLGGKVSLSGAGVPSRQDQAALARHVGERLREAREMMGYSQIKAAKHLGYANSTKLAKIEGGRDSSQIPMWVIKRAATLYDVSADYLLGNSETMEVEDLRHAALREMNMHMREEWERLRQRDVLAQQRLQDRIVEIEELIGLLERESSEAEMAMRRVAELNTDWEDMRGGSRLLDAVERTAAAARTARNRLKRYHREAREAGGNLQPELAFI